jgi:hypothetical protein
MLPPAKGRWGATSHTWPLSTHAGPCSVHYHSRAHARRRAFAPPPCRRLHRPAQAETPRAVRTGLGRRPVFAPTPWPTTPSPGPTTPSSRPEARPRCGLASAACREHRETAAGHSQRGAVRAAPRPGRASCSLRRGRAEVNCRGEVRRGSGEVRRGNCSPGGSCLGRRRPGRMQRIGPLAVGGRGFGGAFG